MTVTRPRAKPVGDPDPAAGRDTGDPAGRTGAPDPGPTSGRQRWLTTQQAADLLGVRRETVYAYVSRGVLRRYPGSDKRSSRFSRSDVERLAARSRPGGRAGSLDVVLETGLTLLDPEGGLYYRGRDAIELAGTSSFEQVAELLWAVGHEAGAGDGAADDHGADDHGAEAGAADRPSGAVGTGASGWSVRPAALTVTREAVRALPASARTADRMRVAVAALAATDPARDDRRPSAVARAARAAIAAAVDSLPERGVRSGVHVGDEGIAERLWSRLTDRPAQRSELRALNAALILLADHELAASTLAARIAASAWADPYLVLTTGLGAGGGALHAAAATGVETLLRAAPTAGHVRAVAAERLRTGERVPGFGHKVYTGRDPRADLLLSLVADCEPSRSPVDEAVGDLIALMAERGRPPPNVDLALGAMVVKLGLPNGAGEAVFLLSRMCGMIGHALEEYPHALRFRPRALYTGPMPS